MVQSCCDCFDEDGRHRACGCGYDPDSCICEGLEDRVVGVCLGHCQCACSCPHREHGDYSPDCAARQGRAPCPHGCVPLECAVSRVAPEVCHCKRLPAWVYFIHGQKCGNCAANCGPHDLTDAADEACPVCFAPMGTAATLHTCRHKLCLRCWATLCSTFSKYNMVHECPICHVACTWSSDA